MDSDTGVAVTATAATVVLAVITAIYAKLTRDSVKELRSGNAIAFRAHFGAFLVPHVERVNTSTGQGDALVIRLLNVGAGPALEVQARLARIVQQAQGITSRA